MKKDNLLQKRLSLTRLKTILNTFSNNETYQLYSWPNRLRGLLRNDDWPSVYRLAGEVSTVAYETAAEHYAANQMAALILKYPFNWKAIGLDKSPKDEAIRRFTLAEKICERTNRRFSRVSRGCHTRFAPSLERARESIEQLLGREPPADIFGEGAFGPGANVNVHGNATNQCRKFFAKSWSVTGTARPDFIMALKGNFHFVEVLSERQGKYACFDMEHVVNSMWERCCLVSSNKISFVPKTAKTERTIAVEPLGNSYLQKSVDVYLKRLLKARWGVDLEDQRRNSFLAKVGSINDALCTIDLAMASDSLAIGLVRYLLPPAWYGLLNRIRSPEYLLPKQQESIKYQKFTSMGNGFCFPLETLCFMALLRAVIPKNELKDCSAYGDDLICPSKRYDSVVELLAFAGFTVNSEKSFRVGPFRESCGADWYLGQDVRPVYLDSHLTDLTDLMIFHNATLRSPTVDDAFTSVRALILSWVPHEEKLCRPRQMARGPEVWKRFNDPDRIQLRNQNGAFTVDQDTFMGSKFAIWNRLEQRWSWTEWLTLPERDMCAERSFPIAKYWAFLCGSLHGEIHLRRKTRRRFIKL